MRFHKHFYKKSFWRIGVFEIKDGIVAHRQTLDIPLWQFLFFFEIWGRLPKALRAIEKHRRFEFYLGNVKDEVAAIKAVEDAYNLNTPFPVMFDVVVLEPQESVPITITVVK